MDDLMKARCEAIEEITRSMLTAAGAAMQRHGDDPHAEMIFAAAIAMFIEKAEPVCGPGFKDRLVKLISKG